MKMKKNLTEDIIQYFKEIITSNRNKTLIGVMTLTDDLIGMGGVCVVPDGGRVRQ